MKLHNTFNTDERGVSPVIGVILMVAITVILAAVIGTFVLELGGSVNDSVTAGVTVEGENTSSATVTLANKGTAERVVVRSADGSSSISSDGNLTTVGDSVTVDAGPVNVSVVAVGPDNQESLIRTFEITE